MEANLSPVFALYQQAGPALAEMMERATRTAPRIRIEAEGEGHTVWIVQGVDEFRVMAAALAGSRLFIADGHHRYETAVKYGDRQRAAHPEASPRAAFNYVLMLLVDADDPQLRILPTHRLIHDVAGFDPEVLLQRLRRRFTVTPLSDVAALLEALRHEEATHQVGLVLPGPTYYLVRIPRLRTPHPVDGLDVAALHRELIVPEVGLREGELDDERHFAYTRDPAVAVERVRSSQAQAAFLLQPPRVPDVLAVAASGAVMPQKSTYFYPKPASGIVFNPLSPGIEIPEP
jgi:uncharacterized protein (DUF1015 family)